MKNITLYKGRLLINDEFLVAGILIVLSELIYCKDRTIGRQCCPRASCLWFCEIREFKSNNATLNYAHFFETCLRSGSVKSYGYLQQLFLPELKETLTKLLDLGASINFYMFRGGTNFGFMNGAKIYQQQDYRPVVTSYGEQIQ